MRSEDFYIRLVAYGLLAFERSRCGANLVRDRDRSAGG